MAEGYSLFYIEVNGAMPEEQTERSSV